MLGKLDLLTISHCFCFAEIVNLRYLNFLIILLIEQLDMSRRTTQLISDSAFIDRKLKFTISAKSNIALKILRERLADLLALQFQGRTLSESQRKWMEIGFLALSRIKLKDEKDDIGLGIR